MSSLAFCNSLPCTPSRSLSTLNTLRESLLTPLKMSNRNPTRHFSQKSTSSHRRPRNDHIHMKIDRFAGEPFIKVSPPTSLPPDSVSVLWLRNDLRVRDHAALALATTAQLMIPVYVFDTTLYGPDNLSPFGFQRTGPYRAAFQVESVKDVRNSLRIRGNDMVLRQGSPAEELLDIVGELLEKEIKKIRVVVTKEVGWEEVREEERVEIGLRSIKEETGADVDICYVWGGTLTHVDDLPFNGGGPWLPSTLTAYKKMVEDGDGIRVRKEVDVPPQLAFFPMHLKIRNDPFPSLREDLEIDGLCDPHDYAFPHPLGVVEFQGGETKAAERWNEWAWEEDLLQNYEETRNESGIRGSSSKISPWLALGCVSPTSVYWDVKKYEEEVKKNESTYSMVNELIIRDYFRWVTASVGSKLYALRGYTGDKNGEMSVWQVDPRASEPKHQDRLKKWIEGQTGAPYVDASMRELAATGFMSNRGRQNVASFLIHDLEFPDWRAGAEYFESVLIDHDVASNWGNWAYIAGVGSDPRGGRKFNVVKQGMRYDPEGFFVTRWCPELGTIPPPMIHEPYTLTPPELEDLEVNLGEEYPRPIVPLQRAPAEVERT